MYLTEKFNRPNKYAGKCPGCARWVESGVGLLGRDDEANKFLAVCTHCANGEPVIEQVETLEVVEATYPPTDEQQSILNHFGEGMSIAVQAGAGTGKTSTLVMLAKSTKRVGQYLAFNAKIVAEAAAKFSGTNMSAKTVHAIAMAQVGNKYRHRLNSPRLRSAEVAKRLGIKPFYWQFATQKKVLQPTAQAGYVMAAVKTFCNSADREIDASKHMRYIDGVDAPDADGNRTYTHNNKLREILQPALERAWADLSDPNGQLKFEHNHYLKLWQLLDSPVIPGDYIAVDEAQDISPVMMDVVRRQNKQTIWCGDSCQAINEWNGAIDALDKVVVDVVDYLTYSFRFGTEIAECANALLDEIPGSKLRIVGKGAAGSVGFHDSPDAVLTRTNAGAISAVLTALEGGRTAFLVGCEKPDNPFSYFVGSVQKLMDGKRVDHPDLACFDSWDEVCRYVTEDPQGDELKLWVKLITDFGVDAVRNAVSGATKESDADIIVSTVHKSKGLEWPVVRIAGDFPAPKDGEKPSTADLRLLYVAVTRARQHLDYSACAAIIGIVG